MRPFSIKISSAGFGFGIWVNTVKLADLAGSLVDRRLLTIAVGPFTYYKWLRKP